MLSLLKFAQEYHDSNIDQERRPVAVDIAPGDGRYAIPLVLMGFEVTSFGVERAKQNVFETNADIRIEKTDFF